MTARLLSYAGTTDGIRFGQVDFGSGIVRRFQYDRLNKALRLFRCELMDWSQMKPERTPWMVSIALKLVREREPDMEAAA